MAVAVARGVMTCSALSSCVKPHTKVAKAIAWPVQVAEVPALPCLADVLRASARGQGETCMALCGFAPEVSTPLTVRESAVSVVRLRFAKLWPFSAAASEVRRRAG